MSSQRGNIQRTRPQKYKNRTVFKNDLHDKTPLTKFINTIQVTNVCGKCKLVLEWKIKYKKYKPIKTAKKCTKCSEKAVKHAYHIMCTPCANKLGVCPKCGKDEEIVEKSISVEEQLALDAEMQQTIKTLSERKRRTFLRYMTNIREKPTAESVNEELTLEDVKVKLTSLKVETDSEDEDDFNSANDGEGITTDSESE